MNAPPGESGGRGTGSTDGWMGWFIRPPYFGLWVIVGFLIGTGIAAFALLPRPASSPAEVVAQAPAPSLPPAQPLPGPTAPPEEETPQVSIRTVPAPSAANAPGNVPLPTAQPTTPPLGSRVPPPLAVPAPVEPGEPGPAPPIEAERSPIEEPVAPPQPEPRAVEPPRMRDRPRPSERPAPVFVPRADTGRVSIYFDADSSTFDRRGRRLPLRVEVYVDGRKRLETSDPEKREFDLGRLPEGDHEIEVVPYVGNLPAQARKGRVRVRAREHSEIEAVLRRDEGRSQVGKLRERD